MKKKYLILIGLILLVAGGVWIWRLAVAPEEQSSRNIVQKKFQVQKQNQTGETSDFAQSSRDAGKKDYAGAEGGNESEAGKDGNASQSREKIMDAASREKSPEDELITHGFLEDLAGQVFAHYIPAGVDLDNAELTLTFRELNTRYGLHMYGINAKAPEDGSMREYFFKYVLTEKFLSFMAEKYVDLFVDELISLSRSTPKIVEEANGEKNKVVMGDRQIADMIRRLARKLRSGSSVLAKCMRGTNPQLLYAYMDAEEKVRQAYFAYWQAKNKKEAQEKPGLDIKQVISEREQARSNLYKALGGSRLRVDAVYIAKWAYRRDKSGVCGVDCLQMIARIGQRIADKLDKRADAL